MQNHESTDHIKNCIVSLSEHNFAMVVAELAGFIKEPSFLVSNFCFNLYFLYPCFNWESSHVGPIQFFRFNAYGRTPWTGNLSLVMFLQGD